MARLICLSCSVLVVSSKALLTPFLSWSATSLSSCLLVASTAAIMALCLICLYKNIYFLIELV